MNGAVDKMNKDEIILSVRELGKTYESGLNKVDALIDVNFDLYRGELLAIMGTSGSGKSTLLNILGTMDSPSEGEIYLSGYSGINMFKDPYSTKYRRENIGFVFQSFNLLKDLSVEENVALPLILKDERPNEIDKRVSEMLALVGLTEWRTHRPVELSGGQQQRVAIARALITTPPIVLADELTGNLDFNTTTSVLNTLVKMKEMLHQSIVMVTHDAYVATYADRVLFFHDGRIVDEYVCAKTEGDIDVILKKFKVIMEGK